MAYFEFLLRFIVVPILLLLAVYVWDEKQRRQIHSFLNGAAVWKTILAHIAVAVIYTTPWDNYLVATGVWYYNPELVTGIVLGYVPIEEYTFFVLETLFVGLWWWMLARRLSPPAEPFRPSKKIRAVSFAILFAAWAASAYFFFADYPSLTYLSIIFFWALPAIFPQFLFGADILWRHRKLAAWTILPMGAYLSAMDSLAILSSTWTIAPSQSTGVMIGGALPVEEAVFFFITATLITFGVTLVLAEESQARAREWVELLKRSQFNLQKADSR